MERISLSLSIFSFPHHFFFPISLAIFLEPAFTKLQILFQISSTIFTFRPCVRPCVDKRDIPPYLHFMTSQVTETKYFLKAYDTHYPLTHLPLAHYIS